MNKINVEGIKLYAYHGCMDEEAKLGGNYIVDVIIESDFNIAAATDDLGKTIDYVKVVEIVKREMAIRSKLIETVGQRIINSLRNELAIIVEYKNGEQFILKKIKVKVTKLNPPINGVVSSVSIEIEE